jgi:ketosteroid isomerase-like protein
VRDTHDAMSQENVDVVRDVFEAHHRRDWDAVYALYDPDIVWDDVDGLWGDWGTARGADGVRAAWRRWLGALERPVFTAEDISAVGDHVLVKLRMSGRGRGSGAHVEQVITMVWTVRAGRVVYVRVYRDRADALAAVDVSAPD